MLLSLSHRINKAGKITPIVALRWRASSFTSTSLLLKRFHVQHTFVRFCHHTYSVTIWEHATLPSQSFILNTLHFNAFALVYIVPLSCRLLIYNFIAFFVIPFWHMFNLYAFFICCGMIHYQTKLNNNNKINPKRWPDFCFERTFLLWL